jgi:ATP-binding cassette subfamily A (ABC1) protein 3
MLYQNFFRLSPGFCFADGLASLALLRQGMKDKSSNTVFDWNVTGASLCYLGFEVNFLIPPLLL